MKKNLFFIIGGVSLIVAIFLLAYYSFMYFNKKQPKIDVNTLEIVLSDEGKINLSEQSPTDNSQISTIEPYKFTVKNKGKTEANYQLLIEDYVSDSNTKLLSRKYLNYSLTLNNNLIQTDNLANIKNNILDTRTLEPNTENAYELKIWITGDVNSTDWMGKTYNYKVSVNPITD